MQHLFQCLLAESRDASYKILSILTGSIPNICPLKCLLQFHEMTACKEYTSDGVVTTLRTCVQLPDF
jgi:hypothetical protein